MSNWNKTLTTTSRKPILSNNHMSPPEMPSDLKIDFHERHTSELGSTWKEAPRQWGHSLHKLAPYVGGFPPALAHYFIQRFSEPRDTILDPFCGGGTAPLEGALHGRNTIGNDAFSYAYVLSAAKCNPSVGSEFEDYLDEQLEKAKDVDNSDMKHLDDNDLRVFYSDYTLNRILQLREVLRGNSSDKSVYLKAIVCGILHGPSDMFLSLQTKDTYAGSVDYVREYAEDHNLEKPDADIRSKALRKQEIVSKDSIPANLSDRTRVIQGDARDLDVADESVDLILTSPPYMRVLDYTWNNWIRLWWLDEDRKKERGKLDLTSDVAKYRTFMRECLQEIYRVLSDDGIAVLVVGDVKKNLAAGPRTLNTAGYIAMEALEHTKFNVHEVIEDDYNVENRGYVVFNQLKYDYEEDEKKAKSKAPIDRCLILKKGSPDVSSDPEIDWANTKFA